MLVHGEPMPRHAAEMIPPHTRRLTPGNRLSNACVADMTVAENMALRSFDQPPARPTELRLKSGPMREAARRLIEPKALKHPGRTRPQGLSGGNGSAPCWRVELSERGESPDRAHPCCVSTLPRWTEIRNPDAQASNRGAAICW